MTATAHFVKNPSACILVLTIFSPKIV